MAIKLETDIDLKHKKRCRRCRNDQFYVFDDKKAFRTDAVCVKCGEVRINWV